MSRMTLKELGDKYLELGGQKVEISGWVRTIRDSKNFAFVELNDGSRFKTTQVIADITIADYKTLVSQNVGAAISVIGEVVLTPENKQPFEIKAESFTLEATSTPTYPLQKKRHSIEFLREIGHLRPRTNLMLATFKIRSVEIGRASCRERVFGLV